MPVKSFKSSQSNNFFDFLNLSNPFEEDFYILACIRFIVYVYVVYMLLIILSGFARASLKLRVLRKFQYVYGNEIINELQDDQIQQLQQTMRNTIVNAMKQTKNEDRVKKANKDAQIEKEKMRTRCKPNQQKEKAIKGRSGNTAHKRKHYQQQKTQRKMLQQSQNGIGFVEQLSSSQEIQQPQASQTSFNMSQSLDNQRKRNKRNQKSHKKEKQDQFSSSNHKRQTSIGSTTTKVLRFCLMDNEYFDHIPCKEKLSTKKGIEKSSSPTKSLKKDENKNDKQDYADISNVNIDDNFNDYSNNSSNNYDTNVSSPKGLLSNSDFNQEEDSNKKRENYQQENGYTYGSAYGDKYEQGQGQ